METKRLKRIKPQPVPRRRPPWRRPIAMPQPQTPQEEVTAALALLRREARFRLPVFSVKTQGRLLLLLLAGILILSVAQRDMDAGLFFGLIFSMMVPFALLTQRLILSERQMWALRQLTATDDLRAIPALILALNWPEPRPRHSAAIALTRLLPRIRPGDAGLLDPLTRARLYRRLTAPNTPQNTDLKLAILSALDRIADSGAVPSVQALAGCRLRTGDERSLQQAARECLLQLTSNAGREQPHPCLPPTEYAATATVVSAYPICEPEDRVPQRAGIAEQP
jgi:hypothetical protein